MKKQIKGLALLALGFVFGGALSLNTVSANAETDYFKMTGVSIRAPQAGNTDVTTNDNGIRFTAEISKNMYETAEKAGEVSVGMFILPVAYTEEDSGYYIADVNEETCFGDSIKYKWLDDEDQMVNADVENARQIVHVSTKAYLKKADNDFYTINGSLLHLKEASLSLDFIGYAYIEVNGEYTFATQTEDIANNAVEVAQTALLSGVAEDSVEPMDSAYIQRYINAYTEKHGQAPTVQVSVDVRTQNSSTSGWVSNGELKYIVDVPFTSYNVTTESIASKEIEGYSHVDVFTEKQVVKFDGTTEIIQNYDYTANKVVLWNGDDKVFNTTMGVTRYYSFKEQAAKDLVYGFDNYEEKTWTFENASGTVNAVSPAVKAKSIYQGKSGAIGSYAASWDGPFSTTAIDLPFETDTFSVIVDTNGYNFNNFAMEIFVPNPANGYAKYLDIMSYGIETLKTYEDANDAYNTDSDIKTLGAGVHKLTVKIPEKVSQIHGIAFRLRATGSTGVTWYVDNFCAEANYFENKIPANDALPLTYTDGVTFTAPTLKSTTLFAEELAAQTKVEYQALGADGWSVLSKTEDGKYSFATDAAVNTYIVKVSCGEAAREYTIRRGITFATFDGDLDKSYYLRGSYGASASASNYVEGTDYNFASIDGYNSKFLQMLGAQIYVHAPTKGASVTSYVKTDFTIGKIGLYLYVEADFTPKGNDVWVPATPGGQGNKYGTWNVSKIPAGYGYYEITFDNTTTEFMALYMRYMQKVYIDAIMILA